MASLNNLPSVQKHSVVVFFTDGTPSRAFEEPTWRSEINQGVVIFTRRSSFGDLLERITYPLHRIKEIYYEATSSSD